MDTLNKSIVKETSIIPDIDAKSFVFRAKIDFFCMSCGYAKEIIFEQRVSKKYSLICSNCGEKALTIELQNIFPYMSKSGV